MASSMTDEYKQALIKAQDQLAELEKQRAVLLRLIETLKVLAQDEMYELTPPPGYEPEGLTAEIRKILSLTTAYLAPTQIRDALVQRGFPHSGPKALLISVHTVLDRIKDELDYIERDGKQAYKAKPKSYGASNSLANMLATIAAVSKQTTHPFYEKAIQEAMKDIARKEFTSPLDWVNALPAEKEKKK